MHISEKSCIACSQVTMEHAGCSGMQHRIIARRDLENSRFVSWALWRKFACQVRMVRDVSVSGNDDSVTWEIRKEQLDVRTSRPIGTC